MYPIDRMCENNSHSHAFNTLQYARIAPNCAGWLCFRACHQFCNLRPPFKSPRCRHTKSLTKPSGVGSIKLRCELELGSGSPSGFSGTLCMPEIGSIGLYYALLVLGAHEPEPRLLHGTAWNPDARRQEPST